MDTLLDIPTSKQNAAVVQSYKKIILIYVIS